MWSPPADSVPEAQAAFRCYLHDRGIRYTRPRRLILEFVLQLDDHFEAEHLVEALRRQGLPVSKATVYRTLPLLVSCGILRQVRFDAKQAHYERAFGAGPHDHMVCRRCGRIIEFAANDVLKLRRRIARAHHFHVISHRFQISGLCWECSITCPAARTTLPVPVERRQRPRHTSRRSRRPVR
ncbi:MAG TPA: transcriptional repressor [Phycisphaerae bacterium]|nr:transcriptional repressor [Phycisphaerae bacterium]HNU46026.1 transcriptional repressor [Phycisphaerae bacterium]